MRRLLASIAVGGLLGAALGAAVRGGALAEAWTTSVEQAWWSHGLHRLLAQAWAGPLRAVALAALGGAAVGALVHGRLALGGRPTAVLGGAVLLLVLGAETARTVVAGRRPCDGPDIVWIVLDALRADRLGCYGHPGETSPWLDALAARSARFDMALSQESYTLASVASYFTSTYPLATGVLYDEPTIDVLDAGLVTVAEALAERGYATAAFVFNPHLQARYRFDQGFETYDDGVSPAEDEDPHVHDVFDTARRMHAKVERWLEARAAGGDDRPAALYLHYRDIHGPYVPPPPYHEMFAPEGWSPAQRAFALAATCRPASSPPPETFVEDLGYRYTMYDGEIRYTDDALAELFALLGRHGIDLEDAVVVVTADHGEEFHDEHPGDPKGWSHGRTLYLEQVRVPLVVSVPDGALGGAAPEGLVVETPVELLDLGPTLLELTGCEGGPVESFAGRSLVPLLRGEPRPTRPVFSGGNHGRGLVVAGDLAYYRFDETTKNHARRHTIRPAPDFAPEVGEQLFDLAEDPRQTRDVADEHAAERVRLRALLHAWLAEERREGAAGTAALDADTADQLRALGYLGGEDG